MLLVLQELNNNVCKKEDNAAPVISHSRNSSDSSGYHEASVLSESPEGGTSCGGSGTERCVPGRRDEKSAAMSLYTCTSYVQRYNSRGLRNSSPLMWLKTSCLGEFPIYVPSPFYFHT